MAKKFDFLSPGISLREVDQSFIPAQRDAEGPIIISRTRKGPANKPVKIKNLDDFIAIFGRPVPGGTGTKADVWREGNTNGPTYASYAAQAWLASEQSPIVMVRLAGEQHPTFATGVKAGWHLGTGGGVDTTIGDNATAYGLFLINSASHFDTIHAAADVSPAADGAFPKLNNGTGSLAAIIYAQQGEIQLAGTNGENTPASVTTTGHYVVNRGASREFQLKIKDSGDTVVETVDFNFDRNSSKYIRNVLNTNPTLCNNSSTSTITEGNRRTYWLGESYTRMVEDLVTSSSAGDVYAFLLPLENKNTNVNWGDRNESAAEAATGWIFSQAEMGQRKLFRLKCLHVGTEIQQNYMIAIEDIREARNPNLGGFGTFSVCVKNLAGQTVEKFSNLNLNPASPNYIGKRIGDQYQEWDSTNRRYRTYGDFLNQSNFVYVSVHESITDGNGGGLLPAGYYGPVRPKGFVILSGSDAPLTLGSLGIEGSDSALAKVWIKGSETTPGGTINDIDGGTNFVGGIDVQFTSSYIFPSIPLRKSGSDGGAPDPFRCYWGIRPMISDGSNVVDPDYCDYLRRLPANDAAYTHVIAAAGADTYEHSFVFSLDDISASTNANTTGYVSGAHEGGTSYSSINSFGGLLDINIRQFLVPLWGGFDGLDIKEKEPLGNHLISDTDTELNNYVLYSINKAIDSVKDPEVVPANLLMAPGYYKPLVTNKLIQMAESRQDVLAIIDLEKDYVPTTESNDDATTRLGNVTEAVSSLRQRNINSSFACAFYPWVQISDNLNGGPYVWIPPSVAALGAIGRSQAISAPWFAPAGFNRGGISTLGGSRGPKVIQARQRLDTTERDKLYEVNINPIATFPAEGVVIFGQKTLQSDQSALDRINVRRLLLYLKSRVAAISRNLLFDPNLNTTWNRFKGQVDPVLADVRSRFGLSDYKVVLDSTTTTDDLIDRNIMYAKIFIKPARAIEFIVVDFVITKTGADFV